MRQLAVAGKPRHDPRAGLGRERSRPNDGKLAKGTRFTLVGASGSCWNVRLGDEDETYIQAEHVAPAR